MVVLRDIKEWKFGEERNCGAADIESRSETIQSERNVLQIEVLGRIDCDGELQRVSRALRQPREGVVEEEDVRRR